MLRKMKGAHWLREERTELPNPEGPSRETGSEAGCITQA